MSDEAEEFQEEQHDEAEGGEQREVYEPEAHEADDHGDTDADRERARLGGWKPQDEANLPEGKWRSAKEFNEVGKRAPEVKRENDLMFAEIRKLNSQVEQMSRSQFDMAAQARKDERAKVIAELEQTKRNAVDEADVDAYDRADNAVRQELRKEQEETKQPAQPAIDPVFYQWQQQAGNEWYGTDPQKTAAADAYAQRIMEDPKYRGNTMLFYQDVGAYVSKFNEAPAERQNQRVDEGRKPRKPGRKREKTFADLDTAAKDAYESQKNMKVGGKLLFKDKEAFAKNYFKSYEG